MSTQTKKKSGKQDPTKMTWAYFLPALFSDENKKIVEKYLAVKLKKIPGALAVMKKINVGCLKRTLKPICFLQRRSCMSLLFLIWKLI